LCGPKCTSGTALRLDVISEEPARSAPGGSLSRRSSRELWYRGGSALFQLSTTPPQEHAPSSKTWMKTTRRRSRILHTFQHQHVRVFSRPITRIGSFPRFQTGSAPCSFEFSGGAFCRDGPPCWDVGFSLRDSGL
jgi:hypothetical protein